MTWRDDVVDRCRPDVDQMLIDGRSVRNGVGTVTDV